MDIHISHSASAMATSMSMGRQYFLNGLLSVVK